MNVVYNGTVIPSGAVVAAGNWAPGPVAITGSAITGALNGGTAKVSIRLTGEAGTRRSVTSSSIRGADAE